jgi:cell division protein DivIC
MFITIRAVNSRRFIFVLYVVLLTGIGIGAGALFLDARGEYDKLKRDQAASEAKLHAARTRLKEQQRILERLRSDPVYVEKVIRHQLGYAGRKEVVFRFDPGL